LCAAFEAAEDDGLTGQLVDTDYPRTLDGDAAEPMTEITGRRILALVEVMKNISPPAPAPTDQQSCRSCLVMARCIWLQNPYTIGEGRSYDF
jgi:hypothetical protein